MLEQKKYCAVKQMIRGIGVLRISTYSQTLNVQKAGCFDLIQEGPAPKLKNRIKAPSGPSSVSGAGDAE